MIYYIVKRAHQYTVRNFIIRFAPRLRATVRLIFYEQLERLRYLPRGTYIFSDIERLRPEEAEKAAKIRNALCDASDNVRLLNHPTASMKRYELLRSLSALNSEVLYGYDVYRLTEARKPVRFPVFVRDENEHTDRRASIGLIHSGRELDVATENVIREGRSRDGIIVVEFVDTSDALGVFRKYSASIANGRIVPEHVLFSREWLVKTPMIIDRDTYAEQQRYREHNPHESELREVCAVARIDYGRIDYALKDGKVCVWEINTNPSLWLQMSDTLVHQTVDMFRWINTEANETRWLRNPVYKPAAMRMFYAMRRDKMNMRMRWGGRVSGRVLKYALWATERYSVLDRLARL
jgi:hypothetical protein